MIKSFARRNLAVGITLALSSVAATPFVMGASRALATSDEPAPVLALRVEPVEVAPVPAQAPAPECLRRVRVVYGSYGTPQGCAAR